MLIILYTGGLLQLKAGKLLEFLPFIAGGPLSRTLVQSLAHSTIPPPSLLLPGPTFLIELGAPGTETVISRPLDVPVLAWSCPTALTAHTG